MLSVQVWSRDCGDLEGQCISDQTRYSVIDKSYKEL